MLCLHRSSVTAVPPSDRPGRFSCPGRYLARSDGVNPEPPIPLPDQPLTDTVSADVAVGGIGARSGVEPGRAR
jgi:hypothetical protein